MTAPTLDWATASEAQLATPKPVSSWNENLNGVLTLIPPLIHDFESTMANSTGVGLI